MASPDQPYPVADLFAGAGGLSLGFRDAGLTPVFALDWDHHACETYRRNLGGVVLEGSALDITADGIIERTGVAAGEWAVVAGGPPCQGFSVQRRGDRDDPRNDLVVRFADLAVGLRPTFIVMENVPTLLGAPGRAQLKEYLTTIHNAGYDHIAQILDAASYGVPQHRRRALVLAWDRSRIDTFGMPPPTHRAPGFATVRDAFAGLPEPPPDATPDPAIPNHTRVRITAVNELRISKVPYGGGQLDVPTELQLPCHLNANGHRHLDVFGRMRWETPAPTITAVFDNFTRGRFAHPVENRSITAREGARLQSFPDDFVFVGPKKDVARQIGNAVPPLLARRIGEAIVAALEGRHEGGQLALPLVAST